MQNVREFSALEFFRAHWEPVVNRVQRAAEDSLEQVVATCQWIEAIGWVSLGVDLNLYDETLARNLLGSSRAVLGRLVEQHRIYLESMVPPHEFLRVEGLLGAGELSRDNSLSADNEFLAPYFFTGEALSQLLNLDDLILRFQEILLFGSRDLPGLPVSVPFLNSLLTEHSKPSGDYSAEEAVAAFVRCLSAMSSSNDLFRDLRLDAGIGVGGRAGLERRMGRLSGWRFGLDKPSIRERFTRTQGLLAAVILSETPIEYEDMDQFMTGIGQLIEEWLRNHPFYLMQGRGA